MGVGEALVSGTVGRVILRFAQNDKGRGEAVTDREGQSFAC